MLKIIIDRETYGLVAIFKLLHGPSIKMIGFCQHMITLHLTSQHHTAKLNLMLTARQITLLPFVDRK